LFGGEKEPLVIGGVKIGGGTPGFFGLIFVALSSIIGFAAGISITILLTRWVARRSGGAANFLILFNFVITSVAMLQFWPHALNTVKLSGYSILSGTGSARLFLVSPFID
jgi:hypothetical protein